MSSENIETASKTVAHASLVPSLDNSQIPDAGLSVARADSRYATGAFSRAPTT